MILFFAFMGLILLALAEVKLAQTVLLIIGIPVMIATFFYIGYLDLVIISGGDPAVDAWPNR